MRFCIDMVRGIVLALEMHVSRLKWVYLTAVIFIAILACAGWWVMGKPAHGFPTDLYVTVPYGSSGRVVADQLADAHVITSPFAFRVLVRVLPPIQSGVYRFSEPVGLTTVAWNLTHGISGIPTIRVTLPEGLTVHEMAQVLGDALPTFDAKRFEQIARPAEGYLFPDTYFIRPDEDENEVLETMRANFDAHWKSLMTNQQTEHTQSEIVTMASILEGEGRTREERQLIAGILWHRIAIGMPLQVDAAFGYEHGVHGYAPTSADLSSSSSYNTYQFKGLPPTPINNPGDEALRAALSPTPSDYLYYLTGTDGEMHYAKTLAEHVANQKKYLK